MEYLLRCLDTIIGRLNASPAFTAMPVRDFMLHQPCLNHHLVHAAMISIGRMPYCRYHNDAAAEFFGIPDHDVSPLNMGFHYQRMKVHQYVLNLYAHHFLLRNDHTEFQCMMDLKDKDGIFQPMQAFFRNVAWNEEGKAAYAVFVCCPLQDLRYYEAYEILGLHSLPARSLDAARFLFRGFSNKQIADELNASVKTVEKNLRWVFQITETASRRQLMEKFEQCREHLAALPAPLLEMR